MFAINWRSISNRINLKIIWITLCLLVLFSFVHQIDSFAAVNRRFCNTSADCNSNQCCADTPIGYKLCLNYEQRGDLCFFRSRTPTCGCAPGLKCVSTMPMEPGEMGHDYSCARVRPFMYYKLMPYLESENELE
ncbi:hypothetical protein BLOT_000602 [Blomia tropicalis]|nr:hypothetical protein BLOT_000602 [Blomia tropicalis]